jgi:hypothetical protein
LGTTTATSGTWTLPLTGLAVKAYSIKARGLYGSNPESAVRTFTVAVATAPTITSVKDAGGTDIPEGSTTYSTSVTLTGTALAGQQVELFDGTTSLGIETATGGAWTLSLTSVAPKAYSIKARGLYGSNPESAVRTFTVAVATAPTITSVKDANNAEIPEGTTTYSTSVTLTGTALAGQQVELFDGTTSLGTTTATSGTWTLPLTGLAVKAYSIKARGLYGSNPESAVRTFTVAVATAPTIFGVDDSHGTPIQEGGITYSTAVKVYGTVISNSTVQIYDGDNELGTTTANGMIWSLDVSGLMPKAYSIKARGLYGSNPESAVRTFTVAVATAPTITSVKDAGGTEVPEGSTTYSTSVTLTGTALASEQLQVLDNGGVTETTAADAAGNWRLQLTTLARGPHSIKARGLYGSNPESAARTFTVATATAPTITSVRDSKGEVASGGSTTDSYVTVAGTALASQQVQVLDNGANKDTATVNANGGWSLQITGLGLGAHSVTAKGLYGSQPVSGPHSFTVNQATPPLIIETSPVTLDGKFYGLPAYPAHEPAYWPTNTLITRVPTSGVAPFSYSSSDPSVAAVNSNGSVYVTTKRGTVTITVRDGAGQTATYSVSVTNVISVYGLGNETYPRAVSVVAEAGLRLGSHAELNEIAALYLGRWPMGDRLYWTGETCGLGSHYAKNLASGAWQCVNSGQFGAYCNIVGLG